MSARTFCWIYPLFVSMVLVGCSGASDTPDLGQVTGVISKGTTPVTNATVVFTPEGEKSGAAATGRTNDQGEYSLTYTGGLKGAPVGMSKVKIVIEELSTDESKPVPPPVMYLPEKSAAVVSGENVINFDLAGIKPKAE